ncbi:hypothetical protein QJS10_CPB11g02388 [Acorus calamus]|uniref:Uncharacterized protein n=1 Tax=Acorus calamus TaxID=4465 RepID=A0AAV9DUN3_ACOCL|nr:hypothetical protein QJS10_CPB11g02388 [Acorus calamus]
MESRWMRFTPIKRANNMRNKHWDGLPRGIMESTSDMELKLLWKTSRFNSINVNFTVLLAIAVGIKQKHNVNTIVRKFHLVNCSVMLFHYDGNVDEWRDLEWNDRAIHILAYNQTKWWFAKRFLHPDIVSIYDYIFLWDEDIGVENFHPESLNCSSESRGPPCTGWVEGMAPVFSRAAWHCVWLLIQNDLIHGWGLDMKLGYCAQGDRTRKVGVIDSEYIIHQGIPSLGGTSANKLSHHRSPEQMTIKARSDRSVDLRSQIRRQSTAELEIFRHRWDQAVREDEEWTDPFHHHKRKRRV